MVFIKAHSHFSSLTPDSQKTILKQYYYPVTAFKWEKLCQNESASVSQST